MGEWACRGNTLEKPASQPAREYVASSAVLLARKLYFCVVLVRVENYFVVSTTTTAIMFEAPRHRDTCGRILIDT